MPDVDDLKDTKNFHLDVPVKQEAFFLKGSHALDWGVQNRLARIFNPASGRTRGRATLRAGRHSLKDLGPGDRVRIGEG